MNYIQDFFRTLEFSEPLSREEFTARYFPKYARPYELPPGLRLNSHGRVMMGNKSHRQAQETKRANIVDGHYSQYLACFNYEKERATSCNQPTLAIA